MLPTFGLLLSFGFCLVGTRCCCYAGQHFASLLGRHVWEHLPHSRAAELLHHSIEDVGQHLTGAGRRVQGFFPTCSAARDTKQWEGRRKHRQSIHNSMNITNSADAWKPNLTVQTNAGSELSASCSRSVPLPLVLNQITASLSPTTAKRLLQQPCPPLHAASRRSTATTTNPLPAAPRSCHRPVSTAQAAAPLAAATRR